jgi:hypothetical protein
MTFAYMLHLPEKIIAYNSVGEITRMGTLKIRAFTIIYPKTKLMVLDDDITRQFQKA